MVTFPIVALNDGEVAAPEWFADITDAVNDHETRLSALELPSWTSYTPAWTGGSPAIGNGTLAGRYRRVTDTNIVVCEVRLIAGSTTTFGSSFWSFSLPFNAAANSILFTSGVGNIYDVSALTRRNVSAMIDTATTIILNSSSGTVGPTTPFTWANGDELRVTIEYEPTS